jgi:hypothetical protein
LTSARVSGAAARDRDAGALVERLVSVAIRGLPRMYRSDTGEFAFRRERVRAHAGGWHTVTRGTSARYAAIVALGARHLPEDAQREALAGSTAADLVGHLTDRVAGMSDLGDVALVCWAAAEAAHPGLAGALDRLRELDDASPPRYVVESAWVVSALAATRPRHDVEEHLARGRGRLLASLAGGVLFPHTTGPGLTGWHRAHVSCFADQVYPIQALARLHASGDDPAALAAADACAARISALQGTGGQWWWHYDARTGALVEGYPVYSVHQHAMAPMALFDLAEAGGHDHGPALLRGLRWMTEVPELGGATSLIDDDAALTWRKVYRGDPHKIVRGARGLATRVRPGRRLAFVDTVLPARAVDHECRPYELGWLLFAWLGGAKG